MNVPAHHEKENSRPVLERLRAVFLRSFRGQHGENIVCVRRVPAETGTLGKANSHFDPTQNRVENRITTLRRLLIGADLEIVLMIPRKRWSFSIV